MTNGLKRLERASSAGLVFRRNAKHQMRRTESTYTWSTRTCITPLEISIQFSIHDKRSIIVFLSAKVDFDWIASHPLTNPKTTKLRKLPGGRSPLRQIESSKVRASTLTQNKRVMPIRAPQSPRWHTLSQNRPALLHAAHIVSGNSTCTRRMHRARLWRANSGRRFHREGARTSGRCDTHLCLTDKCQHCDSLPPDFLEHSLAKIVLNRDFNYIKRKPLQGRK